MLVGRLRNTLPASAGATIDQLDETIRQSIDEVRTVSYLLHPPLLDQAGLELAVRHFVDGLRKRSGLRIDLDVAPDLGRLSSEIELALFRVVQEALTNVSRHSGSANARIGLRRGTARGKRGVILTIEDAGKGISGLGRLPGMGSRKTRVNDGVGLASMRERLHQIGGWLDLESEIGRTVVTAVVPHTDGTGQPLIEMPLGYSSGTRAVASRRTGMVASFRVFTRRLSGFCAMRLHQVSATVIVGAWMTLTRCSVRAPCVYDASPSARTECS